MTKKSHNKKRNVGIIYEQLIFTISKALVEDNPKVAEQARDLIKKYYRPGTELYKEHRLIQAMIIPEIKDSSLATNILSEAKKAAISHNSHRLNREKSRLIRDINVAFGKSFYSQRISEYKSYATIQTLLNEWRTGSDDFKKTALFESRAHEILMAPKNKTVLEEEKDLEINPLVVRLMTEKFNKKYKSKLNEQQQNLIRQYVFAKDRPEFASTLSSIKQKTIAELSRYKASCDSEVVKAKIDPVLVELKNLEPTLVDDDTLGKFMVLCQIQQELQEK